MKPCKLSVKAFFSVCELLLFSMMRQRNVCFQSFVRFTLIGWLVFLSHRLQNSRIFCEPERRRQYSNERSEEGVEKASKAGERRLIFFFLSSHACETRACETRTLHTRGLRI